MRWASWPRRLYVALDPDYPDDRLGFMLADSGAQVVVAKADVAARIGAPRAIEPMKSEATVVLTSGTVTPADAAGGCADLPTLGSAIPGVELTVVDPDGQPAPPDTAGELVIGGVSVSRGYVGHPDLNRAKFFVDAAGCRHYRTGDLVRLRADGQLV